MSEGPQLLMTKAGASPRAAKKANRKRKSERKNNANTFRQECKCCGQLVSGGRFPPLGSALRPGASFARKFSQSGLQPHVPSYDTAFARAGGRVVIGAQK